MSVNPRGGKLYQYRDGPQGSTAPDVDTPPSSYDTQIREQYPYDSVTPSSDSTATYPGEPASGYRKPINPEQWHGDFGPFYQSPEFKQWLEQNVWDQGLYVDWGNMTIINGDGQIVDRLPRTPPRMT